MKRAHSFQPMVVVLLLLGAGGCRKAQTLGPPDSYLVYEPVFDGAGVVKRSAHDLPLFEPMALDAAIAGSLHKQIAVGFVGEMVRTDYFAKQLVRDVVVEGHTFPAAARAAAAEPTLFVIGRGMPPLGAGLSTKSFFGGAAEHVGVPWVGLHDTLGYDRALPQTITSELARRIATLVAGEAPSPLVEGYVRAMEVVAREWRVGEGPEGAIAPDAGTGTQRALFTGVRENLYAVDGDGRPRAAGELLADPGLAATVLYRMAQSKLVGRKVGPADIYASFVTDRVPPGVSPAAVLGPFRNFQAKLLTAWARAILAGAPPKDIADLVEAYARALPAERNEAWRIFVVTTYGATVQPGGVDARGANADAALPALTALAVEVAAGRRSSRAALAPAAAPPAP